MPSFVIKSTRGGLSDYEDKSTPGGFKFGANLDIRKFRDTLSAGQALMEEGVTDESPSASTSPSASISPSGSNSPSASRSPSPSGSPSPTHAVPSSSVSPSASRSPSASLSPSASVSQSHSASSSPSPSAELTSIFTDLIIKYVKCSDGNTYGFGNSGKIYKRKSDGFISVVYDQKSRITGAEEKPSAGGKTYLVWATRTEIHRKEIPGRSDWNDVDATGTVQGDTFPKTNLSDYPYHTMQQVSGDVMIANGPMLAMLAYDDSYTNEALDVIPGNIIKTIVERGGQAIPGCYRAADPDKGCNGAVDAEVPIIQVGDEGDIYYADFANSIATKRLPGGGKVNPGGMVNMVDQVNIFSWETTALSWIDKQSIGNMALMGVFGAETGKGGIYTFGRKYKNQPFTLNLEHQFDADEIGAVCSVNGQIIFSYRIGSTYGQMAVDPNTKATAIYEGIDLYAPIKKSAEKTQWTTAELYMKPLPSGCSVQFWYKIDKYGEFIQAKTADGQSAYSHANSKMAVFRVQEHGEIFEPRIITIPYGNTTAEIYRQKYFFE